MYKRKKGFIENDQKQTLSHLRSKILYTVQTSILYIDISKKYMLIPYKIEKMISFVPITTL